MCNDKRGKACSRKCGYTAAEALQDLISGNESR